MNIEMLTRFFMWCTILNAGLLLVSFLMLAWAGDYVFNMHRRWFPMPRETFNIVAYSFIGVYKIIVLGFSAVPWIALLILG